MERHIHPWIEPPNPVFNGQPALLPEPQPPQTQPTQPHPKQHCIIYFALLIHAVSIV